MIQNIQIILNFSKKKKIYLNSQLNTHGQQGKVGLALQEILFALSRMTSKGKKLHQEECTVPKKKNKIFQRSQLFNI
jgi:hypothetical protein